MDPIKAHKIQALNSFKKTHFLQNLTAHILTILTFTLLCSYSHFSPSDLYASMKNILFVIIPNLRSFLFSPKCLFIVFNAIVVFLVGESKLFSSNPSQENAIYNEYVERSQSLRFSATQEKNIEEKKSEIMNLSKSSTVKEVKEVKKVKKVKEEEVVRGKGGEGEEEDKEKDGLGVEELNKRVEDFIARVNRRRRLEANANYY